MTSADVFIREEEVKVGYCRCLYRQVEWIYRVVRFEGEREVEKLVERIMDSLRASVGGQWKRMTLGACSLGGGGAVALAGLGTAR